MSVEIVYLLGGPPTAEKSEIAGLLSTRLARGVVVEDAGPVSRLGDRRSAIRTRPCHVVVLLTTPEAVRELAGEQARVGVWLDATGLSVEEAVDAIIAGTASFGSPLEVVDYDDAWPRLFEELAAPVRVATADLGARVEHVGSTAVPGLAAKPVIDIDVVVPSRADVAEAIERLRRLGYVYQGDKGIPGREAFMWPPGAMRHHLYVVVDGTVAHAAHVAFRDHLRAHPETAARYAALKRALAENYPDDPLGYTEAKTQFVTSVLAAADGD